MKKILFYYSSGTVWYNLLPVYDALSDANEYDISVVVVPCYKSENARPIRGDGECLIMPDTGVLDDLNIPYMDGREFEWPQHPVDMVICGYPYDSVLADTFSSSSSRQHAKKLFYIPYGIQFSEGGELDIAAYYLPIYTYADAFIAQTEQTRQTFIKHNPDVKHKLIATSLPRFDSLLQLSNRPVDQTLVKKVGGRFCVLWNTHFSFVINRWSCFDRMFAPLIELVQDHPEIAFIFRPHPHLDMVLADNNFISRTDLKAFYGELESIGVIVDKTSHHLDAFALSDCFISDGSSLFIEYVGTGKPMALLRNPHALIDYLPDTLQLLKFYEQFDDPHDVTRFLIDLSEGRDIKKEIRPLAKQVLSPGFDGLATARVVDLIKKLLEDTHE